MDGSSACCICVQSQAFWHNPLGQGASSGVPASDNIIKSLNNYKCSSFISSNSFSSQLSKFELLQMQAPLQEESTHKILSLP